MANAQKSPSPAPITAKPDNFIGRLSALGNALGIKSGLVFVGGLIEKYSPIPIPAQTVELSTGTLTVKPKWALEETIGWGSRINKKRGFLFVSKVLGKHIPVSPQKMDRLYAQMAQQLKPLIKQEPTLVIGMAETATALGHGVFDKIHEFSPDSVYMHTTRYNLDKPRMLNFMEEHCHAPSHILYHPHDQEITDKLKKVKNIVIVDDEISTGNTLVNFSKQLQALKDSGVLPELKPDGILTSTILQWDSSKKTLDAAKIKAVSLYKGDFKFVSKPDLELDVKPGIKKVKSVSDRTDCLDDEIPHNFGRFGVSDIHVDLAKFFTDSELQDMKNKKVLVLGTGEFMYPAFLVAKQLEKKGVNAVFQATTRSPINVEGAIKSKIGFPDNYHENIDNFLYNIKHGYDKILVCYETLELPKEHQDALFSSLRKYCKDVRSLFLTSD